MIPVSFIVIGGSACTYNAKNQAELNDMFRNIDGARERGKAFLQLDKYNWLNINNIISIKVGLELESSDTEETVDNSNLNAVPKILTAAELRAAQLDKQPLIPFMEAAQDREDKMRVEQNLPGTRKGR
jgi:hypothetical protein